MTLLDLITKWNRGIEYGSQAKFAKKVGASTASLAQWVQGRYMPSSEAQAKIAKELDISIDELLKVLLSTKEQGALSPSDTPVKYAKVLGAVSSEKFNCVMENSTPLDVIAFPYYGREDDVFALRVVGKFLEPAVRDGEYVIVRKQDFAEEGQTILTRLGGQNMLKILKKKGAVCELAALNGGRVVKINADDFEIEGVIIMSVRKWW